MPNAAVVPHFYLELISGMPLLFLDLGGKLCPNWQFSFLNLRLVLCGIATPSLPPTFGAILDKDLADLHQKFRLQSQGVLIVVGNFLIFVLWRQFRQRDSKW